MAPIASLFLASDAADAVDAADAAQDTPKTQRTQKTQGGAADTRGGVVAWQQSTWIALWW